MAVQLCGSPSKAAADRHAKFAAESALAAPRHLEERDMLLRDGLVFYRTVASALARFPPMAEAVKQGLWQLVDRPSRPHRPRLQRL